MVRVAYFNKNKYVGNIYKRYAMEKKMIKQMMMALLLAMMPFAADSIGESVPL